MPRRRRQTAYANNGSGEKAHSLAELEKDKKDIGEGNIDEEVHGVASADTHVLPMPRRRRQTAYANNGSGEKAHSLAELEKGDIANKQVRTDVYTTVDNMIGQIPIFRRKTAPKHKFVPAKSGQGIELDNNGPSGVVTATKGAAA
jgi:ureidoglycolate hydrolase